MQYELCYLIGESKNSLLDRIKREVEELVTQEGADLLEPEFLEKRKMAYKVKGETRGIYIARRFEVSEKDFEENSEGAKKDAVVNISKKLKVNPNILRFIIVKAEDLPPLRKEEVSEQVKEPRFVPVRKKEIKKEKIAEKDIDEKLDELLNI